MSNATRAWHCPAGVLLAAAFPLSAAAASDADFKELREQVRQMKQEYEQRIRQLEARLAEAERSASAVAGTAGKAAATAAQAEKSASEARETAQQTARRPAAENAFNPAISLILSGTYANLSSDPATYRIDGFVPFAGRDRARPVKSPPCPRPNRSSIPSARGKATCWRPPTRSQAEPRSGCAGTAPTNGSTSGVAPPSILPSPATGGWCAGRSSCGWGTPGRPCRNA